MTPHLKDQLHRDLARHFRSDQRMTSGSPVRPYACAEGKRLTPAGASELPVTVPWTFHAPSPSTGTVDDDDEPEDEHEDENEAREREKSDDTELPEEFERDDEDRTDSGD
jgi:hypothetical protein